MRTGPIAGACLLAASISSLAQNYTASAMPDQGVSIVRLTDAAHGVEVSIVPSIGNRAYEMKVHGKNILYFASSDVSDFQKRPRLSGIPFLAPWADLLNEQVFQFILDPLKLPIESHGAHPQRTIKR